MQIYVYKKCNKFVWKLLQSSCWQFEVQMLQKISCIQKFLPLYLNESSLVCTYEKN